MALDPFFSVNPLVSSLDQDKRRTDQVRENSSRHAWSYATLKTSGTGEVLHTTVVPLDCTFIERPKVAHGWSMDGDILIPGLYPQVSAGVWKWQQDRREFYIGAYVVFTIDGDQSYDILHDFTFCGIAMKDIPDYLVETK